jgi:hypothetical protein
VRRYEADHVILGDAAEALEQGPLEPDLAAAQVAIVGDVFQLGVHRIVCGDATDPVVLAQLMEGDSPARLILTDEPYNVKIAGHVTGGGHREFAMASGEMSDAEFLAFNEAWMAAVLPCLCDGGIIGSFIDWRGLPTVHFCGDETRPDARQSDRLGEDQRRHGQSLSLAA